MSELSHIVLDDLTQDPTCTECGETVRIPRMVDQTAALEGFKQRHAHHDAAGLPAGEVTMNLAEHEAEKQMALRRLAADVDPNVADEVVETR